MLLRTNHTSFTVSDLDRSVAFYRDKIGMEFISQQVRDQKFSEKASGIPGAHLKIAFLKAPDHKLELIQYLNPPGKKLDLTTNNVGASHLAFEVDNLHEMYESLKADGYEFVSEPLQIQGGPNHGGWMAYFKDPDGITIELQQFPERP